ncbi:heterokaryon incompatibility protein-domain-containing protein [Xylaria sp. FL1777]|nr:heterokaryon incompatibility protein-domain-containing protein [Xylaria sp. FL1777]
MNFSLNKVPSYKNEPDLTELGKSSSTLLRVARILSFSITTQTQWLYQRILSTRWAHFLCDSCLKLRIQLAFSQEFRGLQSLHGIVLGTLQSGWRVDEKCVLCQIVSKTTHGTSIDALLSEATREATLNDMKSQLSFQLRAFPLLPHLGGPECQNRAAGLRNEVSEYFLAAVPDPSSAFSHGVYEKALRDQVAERGYLVCHQSSTRPLFVPRVVSCLFDPSVVEGWLNCCQIHHMCCLLDRYPSRLHCITPKLNLIDCESRRVVNCTTLDQYMELEYVALSYIWGRSSDASPIIKEFSDLPDLLPRVIEDAILVTLSLGYRFIWVDRYCIDQHDASKKHEQIMHMDSIYQYAALTIIAAAGTDETYGLPGVSRRRPTRQWSFEGDDFSITSTLPPPQCSIRESRWATRGWTYQEAVLSTRRLVFTDDQLYFECNSMSSYESLDVSWDAYYSRSRPYLQDFMKPTLFSFQKTMLSSDSRHPSLEFGNFTTYARCAEQYSRRTLSFDSDSLNAFGGIIRKLETAETSPVYHVWGVPFIHQAKEAAEKDNLLSTPPLNSCSLIRLLHLRAPLPDPDQAYYMESLMVGLSWRHDISAIPPRRRADFPSWSWVGWEGAVTWPTISQDSPVRSPNWPSTSMCFEECSEDIAEICDTDFGTSQLRHPKTLCIEAAAMSRNAFMMGDDPQKLSISSGGGVTLYPSRQGLNAVAAFEGIQGGWYEVIRLATVGANSYLMLVELDGQVAYRVGTLVWELGKRYMLSTV